MNLNFPNSHTLKISKPQIAKTSNCHYFHFQLIIIPEISFNNSNHFVAEIIIRFICKYYKCYAIYVRINVVCVCIKSLIGNLCNIN